MRSSRQDSQGGDDREQGKGDQTESVQNHGGKLPITFYSCGLLVITDLVCNHFNFFQNKTKFSGHSRGVAGGRADVLFTGRNVARHPGRKEGLSYVVVAATRAGRGQWLLLYLKDHKKFPSNDARTSLSVSRFSGHIVRVGLIWGKI